jgi:hypothetical protein
MQSITAQVELIAREGQLEPLRKGVEVARALAKPGNLPIALLSEPGQVDALVLTSVIALEHWLEARQIYST